MSSTLARRASSSSPSAPPVKASGLVTWLTPTGATAMARMVPAAALPAAPGSTARARTSTLVSPAWRTPASRVSKRTWAAVMHTVPSGMDRSVSGAEGTEKRSTPSAATAARRSSPRSWACLSR